MQSYLSPAIVVLFVLGVFWKRANAQGALMAFMVGVVGGFARLAADIIHAKRQTPLVTALKDAALPSHNHAGYNTTPHGADQSQVSA